MIDIDLYPEVKISLDSIALQNLTVKLKIKIIFNQNAQKIKQLYVYYGVGFVILFGPRPAGPFGLANFWRTMSFFGWTSS